MRTKLVLREAFRDTVPRSILERPKASSPLPFQSWIAGDTSILRDSPFARQLFQAQAIETVSDNPAKLWNLAWPMMNLALWGDSMGW